MSFIVVLIPQKQFNPGDVVDLPGLNLLAQSTVSVTGQMADLGNVNSVATVSKVFTVFDIPTGKFTCTGHGLTQPATAAVAQRVYLTTTVALPAGLIASTTYSYYARVIDANTLTLHKTAQGAVDGSAQAGITDNGTGVQTLSYTPYVVGVPMIFNVATGKWEQGILSLANMQEMIGASSSAPGARGAVPQPQAGDQVNFLRGDGQYALPDASIAAIQYLSENSY